MKASEEVEIKGEDGSWIKVKPEELVVGDIMNIKIGMMLNADGVYISSGQPVKMGEAALTGESDAVKKDSRHPFMFAGTDVIEGDGMMLVTCVGMLTTQGMIEAKV